MLRVYNEEDVLKCKVGLHELHPPIYAIDWRTKHFIMSILELEGEHLACWCSSTIDLENFRLSTVLRVRKLVTARSDKEWAHGWWCLQRRHFTGFVLIWDVWYWKMIRTSACDTYKFGSRTPCVRPLCLSWNKSRVTSPWHDCISAWPCNGVHAYRRAWNAGSSLCEGRRAETLNRCTSQRRLNPECEDGTEHGTIMIKTMILIIMILCVARGCLISTLWRKGKRISISRPLRAFGSINEKTGKIAPGRRGLLNCCAEKGAKYHLFDGQDR